MPFFVMLMVQIYITDAMQAYGVNTVLLPYFSQLKRVFPLYDDIYLYYNLHTINEQAVVFIEITEIFTH
ncbi:hypothetical protein C0V77_17675 [Emticicia sp. TH156]|nr:hypothetical protein C0V77_17675 [Emticicia sp. TH156]